MRTGLLATAAALALITAGAASAQDLKKNEAPAPAPAAQQKAPAEKVAPDMHAGDRKLPETTGQGSQPAEPEKSGTLHKSDSLNKNSPTGDAQTKPGDKAAAQDGANSSAKSSETTTSRSSATTGQGAAAGAAKLSTEQRTKISSIIREHKTPSVHLNVSVSVGTRVPANVHLYPLPVQVITVYPEWRGYDYVMVGEDIVVIDPRTHEIVAIIEA
ncbi:MAG TPA: DUF1236 domain-containing protein [Pseudolabrys sp.]|nr:DUF1236 domain-containing protein [Pseudolabrys sp.]